MPQFPVLTCGKGLCHAAQFPRPNAIRAAQVPTRRSIVVAEVGARLEALVSGGDSCPARVRVRGHPCSAVRVSAAAHASSVGASYPPLASPPLYLPLPRPAPTPPLRGQRLRDEVPGATTSLSPHPSLLVSGETDARWGGVEGTLHSSRFTLALHLCSATLHPPPIPSPAHPFPCGPTPPTSVPGPCQVPQLLSSLPRTLLPSVPFPFFPKVCTAHIRSPITFPQASFPLLGHPLQHPPS